MKPIRVCLVTTAFPPLYSGSGMQAMHLAGNLAMLGISVTVLTAQNASNLPDDEYRDGVHIIRLPATKNAKRHYLSFALKAAIYLLTHYRQFDIVHHHGVYWRTLPTVLAAKLMRKKCLVKMTQMGTDDPLTIANRRYGRFLSLVLSLSDKIVSISQELTASYKQSGLPLYKLAEIPNGVDTNKFVPLGASEQTALRIKLGLPVDSTIVLFVGQVSYRKGVDLLLDIWPAIVNAFPQVHLLLVGPVGEDGTVQITGKPISNWILELPRVVSVGLQPNVHEYYQIADIFILPTRMEGLPNALLEAMATAVPSIASNIGGNTDLIQSGKNGLLFEPDSKKQLHHTLTTLLKDKNYRQWLGEAARETVINSYSLNQISIQYAQLYKRLLNI